MTNPTKCCESCRAFTQGPIDYCDNRSCPCHKQESWEVEFDNLRRQYSFQVMPWAKQFIRETLQKERERVVGVLEKQLTRTVTDSGRRSLKGAIAEITKEV